MGKNNVILYGDSLIKALEKVNRTMKTILCADELAYMLESLRVYSFEQFSSSWVETLSNRIGSLNTVGSDWHNRRSDIASGFLVPIQEHYKLYDSVNDLLAEAGAADPGAIVQMIHALFSEAKENAKAMRRLEDQFQQWMQSVTKRVFLLDESAKEGWKALDEDEAAVTELYGRLSLIQNALTETQNAIFPDYMKDGGAVIKSFGSITYSVLIAGESISFLSVGGLAISVGTTFLDALSTYADVVTLSKELQECKRKYRTSQQALAQTKSLLVFIQSLRLRMEQLIGELDEIVELWDDEKNFLDALLDSYEKGAAPEKTNLTAETAMWKTLDKKAKAFLMDESKVCRYEIKL